jgi:ubiquinone/menaquinone biosynthesis C-methylase UbiE
MSRVNLIDNGERMVPKYHKSKLIYAEHVARYRVLDNIVFNKRVLDVACGSGYGTRILSQKASNVVGVDINPDSIKYAKQHYSDKNIHYICSNATKIPVENNSFDVIVSYETLEHIIDPNAFLNETKRILKKDGIVIISTPNDKVNPRANKHHLVNYNLNKFKLLIEKKFKYCIYFYQISSKASIILDEIHMSEDAIVDNVILNKSFNTDLENSIYFIAFCSDSKNVNPKLSNHIVISEQVNYLTDLKKSQEIEKIIEERNRYAKDIQNLKSEINRIEVENTKLKNISYIYRIKTHIKKLIS